MSSPTQTRGLPELARIRRNWERAHVEPIDEARDRFAAVEPPLDAFEVAAPLLERLEREVDAQFPEQRAALAPFLQRVCTLFVRMNPEEVVNAQPDAAAPSGERAPMRMARPSDTAAKAPAAREARAEFVAALNDLEDLCEALLHVKR